MQASWMHAQAQQSSAGRLRWARGGRQRRCGQCSRRRCRSAAFLDSAGLWFLGGGCGPGVVVRAASERSSLHKVLLEAATLLQQREPLAMLHSHAQLLLG